MAKPKVLITSAKTGGWLAEQCISAVVWMVGGVPILARPGSDWRSSRVDAVVFSGGRDIHPRVYGQVPAVTTVYDQDRDGFEREVFEAAFEAKLPMLGICRGMQLINVLMGGTLYQEVGQVFDDFLPTHSTLGKIFARHRVSIEKESLIHQGLGTISARVNSLHHQAVDSLGQNLRATAWLKSGLIQGIELADYPWVVGVQWHPEYMGYSAVHRGLFKALVQAARARGKASVVDKSCHE